MKRFSPLVLVLTIVVMMATVVVAMAWTSPYEEQVKAAFLFNFTKFVTWPEESFPGEDAPVQIGVLAHEDLLENLESAVAGKKVRGREIVIRNLEKADSLAGLQILFVGEDAVDGLEDRLRTLKAAPVLTVGDSEGFAEEIGIVNFILVENKVRFEINPLAAEDSGLHISSKLLNLAEIVGERR